MSFPFLQIRLPSCPIGDFGSLMLIIVIIIAEVDNYVGGVG